MAEDLVISDSAPTLAWLKFQQDGGGFVEVKENGALAVTSRDRNVIFSRQRVDPEYGYEDITVMTLQSRAHPTKYLTGHVSDNSVNGNPIWLQPEKPSSASYWRSRWYTDFFPEEIGRGWILLQHWDPSNPQLFFTISYDCSDHLEFQLTDINNSRNFVKEHGAFTLDSPS